MPAFEDVIGSQLEPLLILDWNPQPVDLDALKQCLSSLIVLLLEGHLPEAPPPLGRWRPDIGVYSSYHA